MMLLTLSLSTIGSTRQNDAASRNSIYSIHQCISL
jgi:hypothetical protein